MLIHPFSSQNPRYPVNSGNMNFSFLSLQLHYSTLRLLQLQTLFSFGSNGLVRKLWFIKLA